MDVAHCRINLLWGQHTGRTSHRWADIATIIGLLEANRLNSPALRQPTDIKMRLQRAINEIDGPVDDWDRITRGRNPSTAPRSPCITAPIAGDLARSDKASTPVPIHLLADGGLPHRSEALNR